MACNSRRPSRQHPLARFLRRPLGPLQSVQRRRGARLEVGWGLPRTI